VNLDYLFIRKFGCITRKISSHYEEDVQKLMLAYRYAMFNTDLDFNRNNRNDTEIIVNSIFVVDDEKQRDKMTQEFYTNFRKDIEAYQERIQRFIDSKCQSTKVIDRWRLKIKALEEKKRTYEGILKQQLNQLDGDFDLLKLQTQELIVQGQQVGNQLQFCA
jgi:hypothetical protein